MKGAINRIKVVLAEKTGQISGLRNNLGRLCYCLEVVHKQRTTWCWHFD